MYHHTHRRQPSSLKSFLAWRSEEAEKRAGHEAKACGRGGELLEYEVGHFLLKS